MLDTRKCEVSTAEELDAEIRDIFLLDTLDRGDEICGTLNVYYLHESAKDSSLVRLLEDRGVIVVWHRKE
jgi:hypothetical protein